MKKATSLSAPYRTVIRARTIILCLKGYPAKQVARFGYGSVHTIQRRLKRYEEKSDLSALDDCTRTGRPRIFNDTQCQRVVGVICQPPKEAGLEGLSHWSLRDAQKHLPRILNIGHISHETIRQILNSHRLQPHRSRYYLTRTDPDFIPKMDRILDLYANPPAHLFCFDERTGMQALERKYPIEPMRPGRPERREHTYIRHGTQNLLAAFDVHDGTVYGEVHDNRKTPTFLGFMDRHISSYPVGEELHYILDNLNTHNGQDARKWLESKKGQVIFHFLPFHGSWLNLIEIWFSILTKKCLARGSFTSRQYLATTVLNFIDTWNHYYAHPFNWKFDGDKVRRGVARALCEPNSPISIARRKQEEKARKKAKGKARRQKKTNRWDTPKSTVKIDSCGGKPLFGDSIPHFAVNLFRKIFTDLKEIPRSLTLFGNNISGNMDFLHKNQN